MRRTSTMTGFGAVLCLLAGLVAGAGPVWAAEFPYEKELLLDVRAMPGSKRVPSLEVDSAGMATLDLWCNSVKTQLVIANDTVTVILGEKTPGQCTPERAAADDALMATLEQVTNWNQNGEVLVLEGGGKSLRFRASTN